MALPTLAHAHLGHWGSARASATQGKHPGLRARTFGLVRRQMAHGDMYPFFAPEGGKVSAATPASGLAVS